MTSHVGRDSMPRIRSATKPTMASSKRTPITTTTSSETTATASLRTSVGALVARVGSDEMTSVGSDIAHIVAAGGPP